MAPMRGFDVAPSPTPLLVPGWNAYPWLRHGFSSRAGGVSEAYVTDAGGQLNLGFTPEDDPANVLENRRLLLDTVGGTPRWKMVTMRQVHGTAIADVPQGDLPLSTLDGRGTLTADGLASAQPGLMLAVMTADCVPVLVADTRLRVVAAFHAGWRGTAAAIVQRGIAHLAHTYDSAPQDIIAAIGPSIQRCCYTVGPEVLDTFRRNFAYAPAIFHANSPGTSLDLAEANRRQLVAAGVAPAAITVLDECTACARVDDRRKYFSHRAERGVTGRSMGLIGIAP